MFPGKVPNIATQAAALALRQIREYVEANAGEGGTIAADKLLAVIAKAEERITGDG